MPEQGRCCDTCRYWEKHRRLHHLRDEEYGQCRRRAPLVFRYEPKIRGPNILRDTEWPNTMAYDWCGEYARKE